MRPSGTLCPQSKRSREALVPDTSMLSVFADGPAPPGGYGRRVPTTFLVLVRAIHSFAGHAANWLYGVAFRTASRHGGSSQAARGESRATQSKLPRIAMSCGRCLTWSWQGCRQMPRGPRPVRFEGRLGASEQRWPEDRLPLGPWRELLGKRQPVA